MARKKSAPAAKPKPKAKAQAPVAPTRAKAKPPAAASYHALAELDPDDVAGMIQAGLTESAWVDPQILLENPLNYRVHPPEQEAETRESIRTCGWARRLLVNVLTGRLIDGHLRLKIAIDDKLDRVPVDYGQWTDKQELLLLAALDPITGRAKWDDAKFQELYGKLKLNEGPLRSMLDGLKRDSFDRTIAAMAGKLKAAGPPAPPAANGEPTPAATTPRVAANQGFKSLTFMLPPEHYEQVLTALNEAKEAFDMETQAGALHRLCMDWLEATDESDDSSVGISEAKP